jgi:hypothetical protein
MLDRFTQMFANSNISEQQKRGDVVCIPKIARPYHPTDFRPITLQNADYKIMVRVTAGQIRPVLQELLHPRQSCGRQGNTIFEAVATVRNSIAYAEVGRRPLCVLTLDFKEAIDRISQNTCLPYYGAMVSVTPFWSASNTCTATQRRLSK